jgi:hypothetical protein
MLGKDMSPKPLYTRLLELFTTRYTTAETAITDSAGRHFAASSAMWP